MGTMPLLSCSGKKSVIPAITNEMPHCHWCNGKNVCYDPKAFFDSSGYFDPEEAEYNADQYRYWLEDLADDVCVA